MYDRRVADDTLTFGHSGRLYERSFVFYDHQTNSLWVHVTGEAKTGFYKGTKLTFIPSTVTSWGKWKSLYPETQVLPGLGRGGLMGTYQGFYDIERLGLVIAHFQKARLYPFKTLHKNPVINDSFQGTPIVVAYIIAQRTGTAWKRTVAGKTLTFRAEYDPRKGLVLVDLETNTTWDPVSGEAIEGSFQGAKLNRVTYNPILIDRFKAHYSDGEIYTK